MYSSPSECYFFQADCKSDYQEIHYKTFALVCNFCLFVRYLPKGFL